MPDIAMCYGEGCPQKDKCYRHTAKPDTYQSYFTDAPMEEDGTCHYFFNRDEMKKRKKRKNG